MESSSSYYAAALVLHPSRRTKYIRMVWPEHLQTPALEKVEDLWIRYRADSECFATLHEEFSSIDISENRDLTPFEKVSHDLESKYTYPRNQDEYKDYINGDSYEIGKKSPLEWWLEDSQKKRWPRLSHMAIDILSMPAMSDEPERIFSGARRTISWERSQMQPDVIEWRECLKHWKRSCLI